MTEYLAQGIAMDLRFLSTDIQTNSVASASNDLQSDLASMSRLI